MASPSIRDGPYRQAIRLAEPSSAHPPAPWDRMEAI